MKKWTFISIVVSLLTQEISAKNVDKIPIDIRTCMSILSKKGNQLTDYEKTYMEQMGNGNIKESKIDSKMFNEAFLNELDNTSQAKKYYDDAHDKAAEDQGEKN
jgi:hypothetical protein